MLHKYELSDLDIVNLPQGKILNKALKDAEAAKTKGKLEAVHPDVFAIGLDLGPDYMREERETARGGARCAGGRRGGIHNTEYPAPVLG